MPQNTNIQVPAGVWTMLTNQNVSSVSVQNIAGYVVKLQATSGVSAPTGILGAIDLVPNGIFTAQYLLSDIWPGVSGANRVWAWSDIAAAVRVSHA